MDLLESENTRKSFGINSNKRESGQQRESDSESCRLGQALGNSVKIKGSKDKEESRIIQGEKIIGYRSISENKTFKRKGLRVEKKGLEVKRGTLKSVNLCLRLSVLFGFSLVAIVLALILCTKLNAIEAAFGSFGDLKVSGIDLGRMCNSCMQSNEKEGFSNMVYVEKGFEEISNEEGVKFGSKVDVRGERKSNKIPSKSTSISSYSATSESTATSESGIEETMVIDIDMEQEQTAATLLPGGSPILSALQTAFTPVDYFNTNNIQYTRLRKRPLMSTFAEQKRKTINVALLGGGPSSIIPLLYCLKMKEKGLINNLGLYGSPADSLLLRGRDPQKTLVSLMQVAKTYKTFENLKNETLFYYQYIEAYAKAFETDLEQAISDIYLENDFNVYKKILLWSSLLNRFFMAVISVDNSLQKSVLVVMDDPSSYRSCKRLDKYFQFFEIEDSKLGTIKLEYLSKRHGDMHYAATLFNSWQPTNQFRVAKKEYDFVIDRAGFRYPEAKSNDFLAAMNVDYARFALESLDKMSMKDALNELQSNLKQILVIYLRDNFYKLKDLFLHSRNDHFIVAGAGRAAAEFARRLAFDVVHSQSTDEFLLKEKPAGLDSNSMDPRLAKLNESIREKQKLVVVIDHRRIDPNNVDEVLDLTSNVVFKDFLMELTKFDIVPNVDTEELDYYTTLRKTMLYIKEMDDMNPLTNLGEEAFVYYPSILSSLEKLVAKSSSVETEYKLKLILTTSRHEEDWDEQIRAKISKFLHLHGMLRFAADSENLSDHRRKQFNILHVGGATHVAEHFCSKTSKETLTFGELINSYHLGRIQDSHYRSQNMRFLQNLINNEKDAFWEDEDNLCNEQSAVYQLNATKSLPLDKL